MGINDKIDVGVVCSFAQKHGRHFGRPPKDYLHSGRMSCADDAQAHVCKSLQFGWLIWPRLAGGGIYTERRAHG